MFFLCVKYASKGLGCDVGGKSDSSGFFCETEELPPLTKQTKEMEKNQKEEEMYSITLSKQFRAPDRLTEAFSSFSPF